jgi:hypothetical protein
VIKTFTQIIQRTNLSIGVGPAGIPNNSPYRAYYFAGKDKTNYLEACAAGLETILINIH